MSKRFITVKPEGVFYDGVREANPDPLEVAKALASPTPLQLWVRDQQLLAAVKETRDSLQNPGINSLFSGTANLVNPSADNTRVLALDELLWHSDGGRDSDDSNDNAAAFVESLNVCFYPLSTGVGFYVGPRPFILPLPARELAFAVAKLTARNQALKLQTPEELLRLGSQEWVEIPEDSDLGSRGTAVVEPRPPDPPVMAAVQYFLHTGQEIDILERSASDGSRGLNWRNETQLGRRIYHTPGSPHWVELRQDNLFQNIAGQAGGEELDLEALENLTLVQDADFAFTMLYVVSILAPPEPLASNLFAGGWIDLDDVMEKIGWYPSELKVVDREAKRARIWNYLCYGNRAVVVGKRTGKYHDPVTGDEIDTRLESTIWRIMSIERPIQTALMGEVPRRVQVVISKEWEPLLVSAKLAQYLPLAEDVGRIPPNKVAGDWARAVALVLARLWRMRPRGFLEGDIRPTRRELLTHYTPKTKTVEELLISTNPRRAVKYWHDALRILAEIGFIASETEATRSVDEMVKSIGGYGWQERWLNETVEIRPGAQLLRSLQQRVAALPAPRVQPPGQKRRGRPPKNAR